MASPLKMNQRDDSIASLSEHKPETFIQSIVIRNDSFTLGGRILKKLLNLVTVCDILEIKAILLLSDCTVKLKIRSQIHLWRNTPASGQGGTWD